MKPAKPVRRLLLAAALCAAGLHAPVWAQPTPTAQPTRPPATIPKELEPFEGRIIRRITLRRPDLPPASTGAKPTPGAPLDPVSDDFARIQLRLNEGSPFSAELVSRDVSNLNRTGRFKRVESHVQLLADNSVELIYNLEPQPLVAAVQTVGNRAFGDSDLIGTGEGMVGTPIDPTQLARTARRIEDQYKSKGYYNALVTIDEKALEESGIVYFRVREGDRTKVSVVLFEGNFTYAVDELKNNIKTGETWLLKRHNVDDDQLAQDVASLISFYHDRGHLDVRVGYKLDFSPDNKEAIVNFVIDEGSIYTLRDLKLELSNPDETRVLETPQALGLMNIQPGDVYSESKLKTSMETIRDAYGLLGYPDVTIERYDKKVTDRPLVDTVISIRQGRRFKTGEIIVNGNKTTRNQVVVRQLPLRPDRPLDTTAISRAESRLKQTQLFDPRGIRLTIQPEDPAYPGYRDLLVEVEETNTGKFNLGGSVGSDGGVNAIISLQQNNFDITDLPDSWSDLFLNRAFRGNGQTFSISALPGNLANELSVSLSDPYVFDTNYSGSIGAYLRTREYDVYDEQRVGARASIGKHLGSRWNVNMPFRIEEVQITDIEPDAPTDYFKFQDPYLLTAVGINFSRSSVDNSTFPSKGNRIQFGVEQYIGDSNFNKLSFDYDTYFRLSTDVLNRSTTLRLNTAVRYIPQATDDVPFYERFFLGGQNFRGFEFRGASPVGIRNDNGQISDDPVGGRFSFFAGAEVRQPVYEDIISIVGFLDTGTVDTEFAFDKYRVSVGAGLRIFIAPISPQPLAFDFGFPLVKEETDKTQVFTFSISVPFR